MGAVLGMALGIDMVKDSKYKIKWGSGHGYQVDISQRYGVGCHSECLLIATYRVLILGTTPKLGSSRGMSCG